MTIIKITTTDGKKYNLTHRNLLCEIDKNRLAIFAFCNGQIYEGFSDGEVDEDDKFILSKPGSSVSLGLPYNLLVGYAYVK